MNRPRQVQPYLHFTLLLAGARHRHKRRPRRTDGNAAAAVRRPVSHALEAAHCPAADACAERTVTVKHLTALHRRRTVIDLPIDGFIESCLCAAGASLRVDCPVKRIVRRNLHFIQILGMMRHPIQPVHQLHPRHCHTRFQHQAVIAVIRLHERRMIEQLMLAA